jgi:hypothetical protein
LTVTEVVRSVVIGSRADEHVAAVTAALEPDTWELLDAASLPGRRYLLRNGELYLERRNERDLVRLGIGCQGWLRRFAPPDWQQGVVLDSRDAAIKTAWLTLLAGFVRTGGVAWLTTLDQLNRAEGKLAQYAAATQLGIPAPETLVASEVALLHERLGDRFVLKPLGPGHFIGADDQGRVVFATRTDPMQPQLEHLSGAPFLAQQLVNVRLHLRVVTVRRHVWACSLDAGEVPFDWRRKPTAQRSFRPVEPPAEVRADALRMADHFDLGYSSQDWVVDQAGKAWFLDLNPSGQWLFLPEPVCSAVTRGIARWLGGYEP